MKQRDDDVTVTLCRAVVAYCDVTGFMTWVKRATTSHNDVVPFISKMKTIFRHFDTETSYHTLPIGDGIIAIYVVAEKNPVGILSFLRATLDVQRKMLHLIAHTTYPRPAGFRIRVTSGIIFQSHGPIFPCKLAGAAAFDCPAMSNQDFIGDCLNLGSRLLEVRRDLPAILHESVLAITPKNERQHIHVEKIAMTVDERTPRGVDIEDMKALYTFRLLEKGAK